MKSGELCGEISERNIDAELVGFCASNYFSFREPLFDVSGNKNTLQAKTLSSHVQARSFINNICNICSIA